MADSFKAGQIAMTGSAQQLVELPKNVSALRLKNLGAAAMHFKESNAVSSSDGYTLGPGENITLDIQNPGRIWVIGTAAQRLAWASEGA